MSGINSVYEGIERKDLKSFMNTLEASHANPISCSTLFPSISEYRNHSQSYLITGSSTTDPDEAEKISSGELIVWELSTGKKVLTFPGHSKSVTALAAICFKDKNTESLRDFLISGSEDGTLIIWEWKDGNRFDRHNFKLESPHDQNVTSIAVYIPPKFYNNEDQSDSYSGPLSEHFFVSVSLDNIAYRWNFDKIITGKAEFKNELGPKSHKITNFNGEEQFTISGKEINESKKCNYEDPIAKAVNDKLLQNKLINNEIEIAKKKRNSFLKVIKIVPTKEDNPSRPSTDPKNPSRPSTDPKNDTGRHSGGLLSVAIYVPKSRCVRDCEKGEKGKCSCKPLIITGSWDKTIIIWDLETLERIKTLNGHTKGVSSVVIFDPDYPLKSSKGDDHKPPRGCSPIFVSGCIGKTISFKEDEHKLPRGSSPILVSGSIDKTIIVWDLFEGVKIRRLPVERAKTGYEKKSELNGLEKGHTAMITTVAVFDASPDQNSPRIVSGSEDKDIIIWDLLSGYKIRTISGGHTSHISSVLVHVPPAKSRNHDFVLVSCSKDKGGKNVNLWDFSTDRNFSTEHIVKECEAVTSLTIHDPKDGENNPLSFVAHIDNGDITVWDIIKVRMIYTFKGQKARVNCVAVHPVHSDGSLEKKEGRGYELLVAGCDGNRVITLRRIHISSDNISEKVCIRFKMSVFFTTIGFVSIPRPSGGFSTYLVKGHGASQTAYTKIWDIKNLLTLPYIEKKPVEKSTMESYLNTSLIGHSAMVRCIISYKSSNVADKNKVFLVTSSYDKTAILWSLELTKDSDEIKSKNIHIFEGHRDPIFSIAVYIPPENEKIKIRDPLIFTGSFDNTVRIWDSKSGKQLHELNEHKESVTSISIYSPEGSFTPLLISTGIDKLIIIWAVDLIDISNTSVLRKLPGHTDRVCSLDVYTPTKGSKNTARIVSGSDDCTLMVWKDCLNYVRTMPSQTSVRDAFNLDLKSEERWPLMKEMTKQYGISFWIENTGLYYLALMSDERRFDFFKTFLPIIKQTIRYTNKVRVDVDEDKAKDNILKRRSLLRCAIDIDDVQVVQLVLECWLENVNKDIKDPLTQRLYHASYFVRPKDIFRLAKNHPSLFIYYISNLKLVKSSEILNKSNPKITIYGKSRVVASSCKYNCKTDMWKGIIDKFNDSLLQYFRNLFGKSNSQQGDRQVTPQFLPLVDAASREMLNAYVDSSASEKSVDIFKGDVGKIVNRYLWKSRAFLSHICQFAVYLFYVALYSYSVYRYQFLIHYYGRPAQIGAFVLEVALVTMTFLYLIQELYQIYHEFDDDVAFNNQHGITENNKRRFFLINLAFWVKVRDHFILGNIWNINDIAITGLVLTGTFLRITENKEIFDFKTTPTYQPTYTPSSFTNETSYPTSQPTMGGTVGYVDTTAVKCVYAVATICVYFKILFFLRPFAASGPLVSMILQIAKDIVVFLFILLTMMCSFAQVFWVLNQNAGSHPFGTSIWHSYLFSFMYMLGQGIDPGAFDNSASYPLNILILNVFMLFMILLMLNLLIALMNDSFGRVREKGLAQWRLEQAGVILDDIYTADVKVDPFIYVLTYTSDGDGLLTENEAYDSDEVEKQLMSIEKKIDENFATVNTSNNNNNNNNSDPKGNVSKNPDDSESIMSAIKELLESIAQLNSKVDKLTTNEEDQISITTPRQPLGIEQIKKALETGPNVSGIHGQSQK